MLAAGAAEAVERVPRDVIAPLHGNFFYRVRHVFDCDLDKSVGDLFGLAAANLLRKVGERIAHSVRIEREILCRAENLREEFRNEFANHHVGVGDRQRSIPSVAFGPRICAGRIRPDAESGAIEMQYRAATGGDRMDEHHRRAHAYTGDFGFECAFVFAVKMGYVRRSTTHVEADKPMQSGLPPGLRHSDDTSRWTGKNRVLALEQLGGSKSAG